ncbi:MAG: acyl-CoA dehydrogenase family protein [Hyphomicrobiaceae bacterium]
MAGAAYEAAVKMGNRAVDRPIEIAAKLGPAIRDAADTVERTRRFPEPLLSALFASGLLHLFLPKSLGGSEAHPSDYFDAVAEVARHDGSVAWNMFVANSAALIAPHLAPETAATIFAGGRTLIAWGPPNGCRLKAVEGGYLVNGRWDFASGSRQANWMGAHALVEEADGSMRLNQWGRPTVRTVLFPVAQATLLDTWHTIGLKGTASDSYTVCDVFVTEAFSGTREDPAGRRVAGPLYAFTMQGLYAIGVAGVAVGLAREMLSELVALASHKTPRGQARLADQAQVQGDVARAEAKLGAASAYLKSVLNDVYDSAGEWDVIGIKDRGRVRLVSANAIQASIEVADMVYKTAGVSAIFPGSPFERRFRDIHTLSQQIQSRGAHFEAVGRILLGHEDEGFM